MKLLHIGSEEVYTEICGWLSDYNLEFSVSPPSRAVDLIHVKQDYRAALITCDLPLVGLARAEDIRDLAGALGAPLLGIATLVAPVAPGLLEILRPDAYAFREHPQQIKLIARQLLENRGLRNELAIQQNRWDGELYTELPEEAAEFEPFSYTLDNHGCIVCASFTATVATGRAEASGRAFADLLHADDRPKFSAAAHRVHKPGSQTTLEKFRIRHSNGHYLWVDGEVRKDLSRAGYSMVSLRYRGETGQQESQRELLRMNRLFTTVGNMRKVMTITDDESKLLQEICRIATSDGSFRIAYIGMLDDANVVKLVAHQGLRLSDINLIEMLAVPGDMTLAQVFNAGRNVIRNDIQTEMPDEHWKPFAAHYGVNSFIVLPLHRNRVLVGLLVMASPEIGFFKDQEISLLTEAAADLTVKLEILAHERHRRETELLLQHKERRLREAQEIAHLGSWDIDFRTGRADWSEECLRIYGLPANAGPQSHEVWKAHIHPDDYDFVVKANADASRTLSPAILQHRILRADGMVRFIHSEAHFIMDDTGSPTGLHGIAHDITDLKEKERKLQESEQRYITLFNDSPEPKWIYDPETYRFVQVNRVAVEKYGYSEEEFYGMTIFDIRPVDDRARVTEFVHNRIQDEQAPLDRKFRHCTKSGELLEVEIYSTGVLLNGKEFRLVIAIDVTAMSMHEDRMTSAVIQAQENERYEIGAELHDNVCQILAAGIMELAMLKSAAGERLRNGCDKVQSSIRTAIKEVRNLSHRLAPASFDESTLPDSIRLLMSTYQLNSGLGLDFIPGPSFRDDALSKELKLHLYRIIQEQLNNILKHAEATEALVRIECSATHLKMEIHDNGGGFEVAGMKYGIGLSNMRRRADLFRGTFDVTSSPGAGCRITVLIPLSHPRSHAVGPHL